MKVIWEPSDVRRNTLLRRDMNCRIAGEADAFGTFVLFVEATGRIMMIGSPAAVAEYLTRQNYLPGHEDETPITA